MTVHLTCLTKGKKFEYVLFFSNITLFSIPWPQLSFTSDRQVFIKLNELGCDIASDLLNGACWQRLLYSKTIPRYLWLFLD